MRNTEVAFGYDRIEQVFLHVLERKKYLDQCARSDNETNSTPPRAPGRGILSIPAGPVACPVFHQVDPRQRSHAIHALGIAQGL